jgi:alkylation response protein AidB-like acyl-CoA dehydrogenase
MSFAFNEDQKLLAESVDRFILDDYSFEDRRKTIDMNGGFSEKNWKKFGELGWLALPIPEEFGGLGGSTVDVAVLLEGFGRGLVVEPYQSTIVLGSEAISLAGTPEQKRSILGEVAEGKKLLSFAHTEPRSRFNLRHVELTATKDGDSYKLSGEKAIVHNAETADLIIVSARTSGDIRDGSGITLFLVNPKSEGLEIRSYPTIDGLRASELSFDSVIVASEHILGGVDGGFAIIEKVIDRASVLLCAEAVGAMDTAVKLTVGYIKNREQFGQPIGAFQVLQHRSVEMLGAKDFSRALTYRAAGLMDDGNPNDRARAVSAAKVETGLGGKLIGQDGVQLHGGMGMTDDMAIGHFFKRLTMIDALFGNVDFHRRRFAQIS